MSFKRYDLGTCQQTGYKDAGERWTCQCGALGDVEEIEKPRPGPRIICSGCSRGDVPLNRLLGVPLCASCVAVAMAACAESES